MSGEFKHKSVGGELTQPEYEAVGGHDIDSQATGDIIYASSTTQLSRLAKGTNGYFLKIGASIPAWAAVAEATRGFFAPATNGTELSIEAYHPGYLINLDDEEAYIEFYAPHDFSSIVSAVVARIAKATATHRLDYESTYGAAGASHTTHTGTLTNQDTAETDGNIYEADISSILGNLAAGDYVGIRVRGAATNVPNDLIIGLRFRYS